METIRKWWELYFANLAKTALLDCHATCKEATVFASKPSFPIFFVFGPSFAIREVSSVGASIRLSILGAGLMRTPFVSSLAVAILAVGASVFAAQGNSSPYTDAIGDISPDIGSGNPGGGTLDITGMEISAVGSDLIFALTVNGDVSTTDWGKFMIGIAPFTATGTTTGNGWGRPINMALSPAGSPAPQGMSYWIGSWVDSGGGAQLWTLAGGTSGGGTDGAWSGPGTLAGFSFTAGATSTMTYTVPMASVGVAPGDTFSFDAYSSGGGGGDTAIDALANPNIAVSTWGETYTSQPLALSGPGLNSFTVPVPEPSTVVLSACGIAGTAAGGRLLRRRRRRVA